MGNPLTIVADTPSNMPGLGFRVYAEALADAIRGGRPAQFTIGIYGPWGSGKSSLLYSVFSLLSAHQGVIPVMFDAWRYEGSGPIIIPMLHCIAEAAEKHSNPKVGEQARKTLSAFVYSISYSSPDFGLDMSKFRDAAQSSDLTDLDNAFARPFRELKELASALQGHRFAILIDDLDRCSPQNVVEMLETINVIMDVPGLVFVIALDYEVLIKAINEKYPHVSGHNFVEKMVQVPFRVPRLRLYADSFLSELIPNWALHLPDLPRTFPTFAYQVATVGLDANPRRIKRFVNSLLVLSRIIRGRGLRVDFNLLAGLVGLQLRWPDEYGRLAEAVYSDSSSPVDEIHGQDKALDRYLDIIFKPDIDAQSLSVLLGLTEIVASSAGAPTLTYDPGQIPGFWIG